MSYRPRRATNESLDFVKKVLKDKRIPFICHETAQCIILKSPYNGHRYQYFYTTGRWSCLRQGKTNDHHYWSKGINDFIEKYIKWPQLNKLQ